MVDIQVSTKVFSLAAAGFLLAFASTPILTNFLYKNRLGKQIRAGGDTPVFTKLHASKAGTPTMGGILIWGSVLILAMFFWTLDRVLGVSEINIFNKTYPLFHGLNFLTRKETLLPLGALIGASLVGLLDDFLDARKRGFSGRGLRFRFKIFLYAFVAAVGAWWFYSKLAVDTINIPFYGDAVLGLWYIPFFIFVVVGTSFAVNQADGLDGLAGGTLFVAYLSMAFVSFMEGRINLTAMLGVVVGSLLAFLWFNVYPARFFMGDTGSMGLGVLLAIVAFLTDTVLLLPFFGFIFVGEALSYFLQLFWKKVFKRKLFIVSPIHHHLEAKGWPETKITMRFWIISWVMAIVGMLIYFVDK